MVVTSRLLTEMMVGNLPSCKVDFDFPNPRRHAIKTAVDSPIVNNFDPCQSIIWLR
jgi:hypothetical protein